jgi:hypothetical protein
MQSLFIPDQIQIDLLKRDGNPFQQKGIMVGIRTFATHKNDINLAPFLSDQHGIVKIKASEVRKVYENFVSYGIMDYSTLESAKPDIQIYYCGIESLNDYISYWTKLLSNKVGLKQVEMWGSQLGKLQQEFASIEKRERQELEIYSTCYNREVNQKEDIILVSDTWAKPNQRMRYKVKLDFLD